MQSSPLFLPLVPEFYRFYIGGGNIVLKYVFLDFKINGGVDPNFIWTVLEYLCTCTHKGDWSNRYKEEEIQQIFPEFYRMFLEHAYFNQPIYFVLNGEHFIGGIDLNNIHGAYGIREYENGIAEFIWDHTCFFMPWDKKEADWHAEHYFAGMKVPTRPDSPLIPLIKQNLKRLSEKYDGTIYGDLIRKELVRNRIRSLRESYLDEFFNMTRRHFHLSAHELYPHYVFTISPHWPFQELSFIDVTPESYGDSYPRIKILHIVYMRAVFKHIVDLDDLPEEEPQFVFEIKRPPKDGSDSGGGSAEEYFSDFLFG